MRQHQKLAANMVFSLVLIGVLVGFSPFARADNGVYSVSGVQADVTADSAVHAKDQAIAAAQRTAFKQLLDRLNGPSSLGDKLSADDIATLVQSFEVESERSSAVHYIGQFTVNFRPSQIRKLVGARGGTIVDTPGKPELIVPLYIVDGRPLLWEDTNRWRAAWAKATHSDGLVPIVMPNPGEDTLALTAQDAAAGKLAVTSELLAKYDVGGLAVVTLTNDSANTLPTMGIDVLRYGAEATALPVTHLSVPLDEKTGPDAAIAQGVKQVRQLLDKDWRQQVSSQQTSATTQATGDQPVGISASLSGLPPVSANGNTSFVHLPVTVPIASLPEWANIRRRLLATPGVGSVDVLTLARGATSIDIGFHGSVEDLQAALLQQHLQLSESPANNTWFLQSY